MPPSFHAVLGCNLVMAELLLREFRRIKAIENSLGIFLREMARKAHDLLGFPRRFSVFHYCMLFHERRQSNKMLKKNAF